MKSHKTRIDKNFSKSACNHYDTAVLPYNRNIDQRAGISTESTTIKHTPKNRPERRRSRPTLLLGAERLCWNFTADQISTAGNFRVVLVPRAAHALGCRSCLFNIRSRQHHPPYLEGGFRPTLDRSPSQDGKESAPVWKERTTLSTEGRRYRATPTGRTAQRRWCEERTKKPPLVLRVYYTLDTVTAQRKMLQDYPLLLCRAQISKRKKSEGRNFKKSTNDVIQTIFEYIHKVNN
jgi:hypothetical protein